MRNRNALLLMPSLKVRRCAHGPVVLTRKFLDGVKGYVERWPGPVIVVMEPTTISDGNLDHQFVDPARLPFKLKFLPDEDRTLRPVVEKARVVLATLVDKHTRMAPLCRRAGVPLVYLSEYTLSTRRQIIRTEVNNPLLRLRREWWTSRLERRYGQAVRLASGIQCNGTPTFNAYRSINGNPMLYFDSRVRAEMLASPETIEQRISEMQHGEPLRLAFSGRLIAMKGADHLPRVVAELDRMGVDVTLEIFGDGESLPNLQVAIEHLRVSDRVHLRGVVDFESELMPRVARHVDLFVCCHRQGDPSCTYLETMACGTPIVGYDNEGFAGVLQESGIGWTTRMDDPEALARRIAELNEDRAALAQAARDARSFAAKWTFEDTMQRRVDHLLDCSGALEAAA